MSHGVALGDRFHCAPSEPHTVGPMPGVSLGPMTAGAGAVAEDEGAAAVVGVGEVAELLDSDDEHVVGADPR